MPWVILDSIVPTPLACILVRGPMRAGGMDMPAAGTTSAVVKHFARGCTTSIDQYGTNFVAETSISAYVQGFDHIYLARISR